MHGRSRPTRREFIGAAAGAAAGLAAGLKGLGHGAEPAAHQGLAGIVARAHSPRATVDFAPQQDVVDGMVASALTALTGYANPVAALGSLFPPIAAEDRIVLKPNTLGNPAVAGTRAETLASLVRLLRELPTKDGAKVRSEQVIVWDNLPVFALEEALDGLCSTKSTYAQESWDLDARTPLELPEPPNDAPLLAQRVVTEADHLISVAALKHHPLTATTGAMKNYFGAITRAWDLHTHGPLAVVPVDGTIELDGEAGLTLETDTGGSANAKLPAGNHSAARTAEALRPQLDGFHVAVSGPHLVLLPEESDDATQMTVSGPLADYLGISGWRYFECDLQRSVAGLYSLPEIGGKTRLCIIDGLVGLYDGGPYHMAQEFKSFPERTPNTLLFGTDAVAVDAVMSDIVMKERALHDDLDDDSLRPTYLAEAEAMGLGVGDLARIRVVDAPIDA